MKTLYILDSSGFYIKKTQEHIINENPIKIIHLKQIEDVKKIEGSIVFIANDTEDLIDYLIISEIKKNISLIITSFYLLGKLKKSTNIKFYEFDEFLKKKIINS